MLVCAALVENYHSLPQENDKANRKNEIESAYQEKKAAKEAEKEKHKHEEEPGTDRAESN